MIGLGPGGRPAVGLGGLAAGVAGGAALLLGGLRRAHGGPRADARAEPRRRLVVSIALALKLASRQLGSVPDDEIAALLQETGDELAGAMDELRELARGIYPVLLTDAGLGPAVTALAARSPIPAVVAAVPGERLPEPVEQAAYFVVSEALANAAKHSAAGSVTIDARSCDGSLVVTVVDDGVGGADPGGSGLRGLADRFAAAGGTLLVHSPAGGGTRLIVELPRA